MTRWIFERLFGRRMAQHTADYLDDLRHPPMLASGSEAADAGKSPATASGPAILLGKTPAGEKISLPVSEIVNSFALVTGGTGSGKTSFGLSILEDLIAMLPQTVNVGACVLDPKEETFRGALYLLKRRLGELGKAEARELRRRVVLIDFSQRDPLSSYNLLARWPNADRDFFAGCRSDMLLDLLPGGDALSLGGSGLLRRAILLLSEFGLPIGWLDGVLFDDILRAKLLARSTDKDVIAYFTHQFPSAPKQTAAALSRRMEALFSSEALRCTLSGPTAPDFRALQDEGKFVLVNCAGPNLSRGVRRVLQAVVVSDFCHAVFSRKRTESSFLLLADEGQNCFLTERLRDQMADFFCMGRSFGTQAILFTQAMAAAVREPRLASVLHTNIRWSFSMRGEPSDAAFLKGALPVTGRKRRPQRIESVRSALFLFARRRAVHNVGWHGQST